MSFPIKSIGATAIETYCLREVQSAFGVTHEEILGPCRKRHFVRARQMVCLLLRQHASFSLPEIGRVLKRDHTTVLHNVRAAESNTDRVFVSTFNRINAAVTNRLESSFNDQRAASFWTPRRDKAFSILWASGTLTDKDIAFVMGCELADVPARAEALELVPSLKEAAE